MIPTLPNRKTHTVPLSEGTAHKLRPSLSHLRNMFRLSILPSVLLSVLPSVFLSLFHSFIYPLSYHIPLFRFPALFAFPLSHAFPLFPPPSIFRSSIPTSPDSDLTVFSSFPLTLRTLCMTQTLPVGKPLPKNSSPTLQNIPTLETMIPPTTPAIPIPIPPPQYQYSGKMVNLLPKNVNTVLTMTCAYTVVDLVTRLGIVQDLKSGSVPFPTIPSPTLIPAIRTLTMTPEIPMPNPLLPSLTIIPSILTQVPFKTLAPNTPTLIWFPGTPNLTLNLMIPTQRTPIR